MNCGYDVSDVRAGGMCPECGRPACDERDVIDHRARRERRWRFALQLGAMAIGLVLLTWVVLAAMYD